MEKAIEQLEKRITYLRNEIRDNKEDSIRFADQDWIKRCHTTIQKHKKEIRELEEAIKYLKEKE
ncbi:hypothetical protein LCGC14_2270760 [marine sediment metagenome]|uniref:Uncharacterized protein n=1 Tax=marine sediment metagenome TaxID=412755 RepID=A0A0F9F9H6_9ZZZZ